MKERVGQKIKLTNYEALLGVSNEESAVDVSIRDIHSFENHPFKVIDDDKMAELVESIKVNGVLTPVLIRPSKKTRGYEMISGHRRLHAAGLAGLSMIPAIVREMDDDTAVLAMVDANIQREELLPSEKAFAFKMKMDAMRHQGTSRHEVEKSEKWTCEKVGEAGGIGGRQVQRYIRLTELIPELIEFVDKKKIQLSLGVDISYIDKEIQKWIYEYIKENGTVKPKQISALREECEKGVMTQPKLIMIDESGKLIVSDDTPVHVLSYDEKPGIQAIATTSDDLMPDEKHPTISRDYEYKRLGTLSLLAAIDLQTGEAIPLVRDKHSSKEYIEFLKLLDDKYPKGDKIRIVLDNLKVHTSEATRKYLATVPGRFEFVFTPKHGSWLNMVEGFFSKMTRQMLRGIRVNSKDELTNRIYKYFAEINEEPIVFHWKYNLDDIDVSEEIIVDTLPVKKSS